MNKEQIKELEATVRLENFIAEEEIKGIVCRLLDAQLELSAKGYELVEYDCSGYVRKAEIKDVLTGKEIELKLC